jgi:hypothetical protein
MGEIIEMKTYRVAKTQTKTPSKALVKPKISFDICQTTEGGLFSIDAVVPEHIAMAFLEMLQQEKAGASRR